ncbi:hypothetical protein J3A83DRAFT_4130766 [Scleroderma citrinum]
MDRHELIRNAVAFLSDSSTQQAPLVQRVQFLEAKGLTAPEIEEAMKQAARQTESVPQYQPAYLPLPYLPQPWDWRDYFITAVISGTVVYGAVSLFQKYLLPHLKPPSATAFEQDRDTLTAQFDAAEALLREIQAETATVRAAMEEQRERVDKATKDVESVVVELRQGEARTRDEMREIRDEVENIREMLPKMIDKNKDAHKQSLSEFQQELKSLKTLLLGRGSGIVTSTPSTPLPGLAGRPSIPSWQLAGISPTPSSESPSPDLNASPRSPPPDSPLSNLRKSIAVQRVASAAPQRRSTSPSPLSVPKSGSDTGIRKSRLEERLRASFTIGDSPGSTTPNAPSSRASPTPDAIPVIQHPLSPESIPLPGSPTQVTPDPPSNESVKLISRSQSPAPTSKENDSPVDALGISSSQMVPRAHPSRDAGGDISHEPTPELVKGDTSPLHTNEGVQPEDIPVVSPPDPPSNSDSSSGAVTIPPAISSTPGNEEATPDVQVSVLANSRNTGVEALQERLKLVEQRFADVSTSFKKLQAERLAADSVIRELTPLEDTKDLGALRDYLTNINMKVELTQDELQRLSGKLTRQEEHIEELRDMHRLEMASQLDRVENLKKQLAEAEALISASQVASTQTQEEETRRRSEIEQLTNEVAKAKEFAKEEEEKRVKAIGLLKTVRQKLVKAEKERDDAVKELDGMREKEREARERERSERAKLQNEINTINLEREKAVTGLRAQFEKELYSTRTQFNAEIDALKTSRSNELAAKNSQISTLEKSANKLSDENKSLFDQLQLRQAELESSQLHAETLQSQNTELEFRLRETEERNALAIDELHDLRSEQEIRLHGPNTSVEDISQLINAVETKYEVKLSDLRRTLGNVEKERNESEANWSRKLLEKTKEMDELRRLLQTTARSREQEEDVAGSLRVVIEKLKSEAQLQESHLSDLQALVDRTKANESILQTRLSETMMGAEEHKRQLEESKAREVQLHAHNKALRDELRKVQNSVTVLERQRNPGVGFWTSRTRAVDSRASISSTSDTPSRVASPEPSSRETTVTQSDEDINYEYLRNVILQFLEHKEMRPNLVRVLSTILRFTPQETRRLIAKV